MSLSFRIHPLLSSRLSEDAQTPPPDLGGYEGAPSKVNHLSTVSCVCSCFLFDILPGCPNHRVPPR